MRQPETSPAPADPALALELTRLRERITRYAPYDADFPLAVPGVMVSRTTKTHEAIIHGVQQPALCIVAQGNKSVVIGTEQYSYDPERMMVYAVNLPIAFRVTEASVQAPFLTVKLDLDLQRVAELAMKVYPHGLPKIQTPTAVQVTNANAAILNAAVRLLDAVENDREAQWIGPLIVDEILMRLLLGPAGPLVAQLGQVDSSTQRVSRAIEWMQQHVAEPLAIESLAESLHMGVSTFHAHFKAVTGMSPLQFQKNLRLQEARRLLVATPMDAGTVSREVGYASASQFTREYTRLFGRTPRSDQVQLRAGGGLQPH